MNLRTRIAASVVTAAAIGTLVLGSAAIALLKASQISSVDDALRVIAQQVASNPADPVSEATLAVDDSPIPVALGFVAPRTELVWLSTIPTMDVATPASATITAAQARPVSSADGFRLLAIALPDGAKLVLAASLNAINQESQNNFGRILWLWLPFNAALAFVVSRFVGRDIRHVEQLVSAASEIAAGADVAVPQSGSTSEARTLATALERLVLSLRQALVTERIANERMQEFLGDASHELRTPLTVIKGYLELLERPDGLDAQQRERALERMRTEAGRMEVLINDLLLLAEIGSTRAEDFSDIDLTGLVRVMAEDFRLLQPDRVVTTNIEAGVNVKAVASHMHRAIANAMANVQRHTPADAAVNIDLHHDVSEVVLTIEDGGPGLSDEHYAKGIGHFQRFDTSRSRATGGSGLGMSIMTAVVRELGGNIELRRSSLGGLALDFRLPYDRD